MQRMIEVNGRGLVFVGSPDDPYFQRLPDFHAVNADLARVIAELPDDAVSLDVGANIGLTALTIATARPNGQVFAFEPSPRNLAFLRRNIEANNIRNVTVVGAAVGANDGGMVQFNMPKSAANGTVLRSVVASSPDIASVPAIRLDAWVGSRRVDFMKIDVEGYEADVIFGAASLIGLQQPPILMEFNSVTAIFEAGCSPLVFARRLDEVFRLWRGAEPINDVGAFVLSNLMERGCVEDITLRFRPECDAADIRGAMAGLTNRQPIAVDA